MFGGKKVKRKSKKKGLPPALKPWFNHLTAFRKEHPKMSLKECMKAAKKTYKKKKSNK